MNTDAEPRRERLDLPAEHRRLLRDIFRGGLDAATESVEKGSRDPDRSREKVAVYGRLIEALDRAEIVVPDETARSEVEEVMEAADRENNYAEVVAEHDALGGLLARLGGAGPREAV
jgi:hypothetical protein